MHISALHMLGPDEQSYKQEVPGRRGLTTSGTPTAKIASNLPYVGKLNACSKLSKITFMV